MKVRTTGAAALAGGVVAGALLLRSHHRVELRARELWSGVRQRLAQRRPADGAGTELTGRPVPRSVAALTPPPHVEQEARE